MESLINIFHKSGNTRPCCCYNFHFVPIEGFFLGLILTISFFKTKNVRSCVVVFFCTEKCVYFQNRPIFRAGFAQNSAPISKHPKCLCIFKTNLNVWWFCTDKCVNFRNQPRKCSNFWNQPKFCESVSIFYFSLAVQYRQRGEHLGEWMSQLHSPGWLILRPHCTAPTGAIISKENTIYTKIRRIAIAVQCHPLFARTW